MADGYKYYSQTSSGWEITTDPEAPPDKRWRIVHERWGTRYFDEHDKVLEFTLDHMVKQYEHLLRSRPELVEQLRKRSSPELSEWLRKKAEP